MSGGHLQPGIDDPVGTNQRTFQLSVLLSGPGEFPISSDLHPSSLFRSPRSSHSISTWPDPGRTLWGPWSIQPEVTSASFGLFSSSSLFHWHSWLLPYIPATWFVFFFLGQEVSSWRLGILLHVSAYLPYYPMYWFTHSTSSTFLANRVYRWKALKILHTMGWQTWIRDWSHGDFSFLPWLNYSEINNIVGDYTITEINYQRRRI